MCRTDWGRNALEDLKNATKQYKEKKRMAAIEKTATQKQSVTFSVDKKAQEMSDRSFKCYCCKRQIMHEAKYQCMHCESIGICKLCYKGAYHNHHQFVVRSAPDKDWEPAFREGIAPPSSNPEDCHALYQIVLDDLNEKRISSENFEMLLALENKLSGKPTTFSYYC